MTGDLSVENRIVAAIRQIVRAVDLHSRQLVKKHGLTGPQLATLQEAAALGPLSAGALAKAVHLSQPTVTGILDRLERRRLVERDRNGKDRRTVTVAVTEYGKRALEAAPSLLQDRFRRELSKLEEWEQTTVLATLQRVVSMMEAEDIEASPVLVTGPMDATVQEVKEDTAALFSATEARALTKGAKDRRPQFPRR
jgi:DNA-binding MarR family transcriptional regulator